MTGRQHASLGLAGAAPAGAALAANLGAASPWLSIGALPVTGELAVMMTLLLLILAGALLGALLPDLDTQHSLLEATPTTVLRRLRRWPLLWLLAAPGLLLLRLVLGLANWLIMLVTDHRGLTHSLLGLLAATLGLWLVTAWAVGPALTLGFVVGYASHLMADMLTPQGVRLAMPLSNVAWHLLPRPLRFGGASWQAGCLTVVALSVGLAVAALLIWRMVSQP